MSTDELVDVLDEFGNKTGQMNKRLVHERGLWHAGAHVWIYNSKGEVLLQLRAPTKPIYPNTWDISAAGHLLASESHVGAALRETEEELGLKLDPGELKFIGVTRTDAVMPGVGWTHNVFDWNFILRKELDPAVLKLQAEELTDVRWFPIEQVVADLHDEEMAKQYSTRHFYFFDMAFTEIKAALRQDKPADIHKAGGIIIKDRKVLVEHSRGKEFFIDPGGKLEAGETPRQALVRELKEEFQIDVDEADLEPFGSHTAEAANQPGKTVHIDNFLVKKWRGEIRPDNEVEETRWITSEIPPDMKLGSIFKTEIIPKLKAKGMID